jgi:hypothetical protein
VGQRQAEGDARSRAGDRIESLPDGSTRVVLSASQAPGRLPVTRHEWRLRPGSLEVQTRRIGLTRTRRYTDGLLWQQPWRDQDVARQGLVLQTGRQSTVLAVGEETQIRSLGELIASRTGWRLRVSREPLHRATGSVLAPLPLFFLISGLVIAVAGFSQARRAADQIRQLRPVTGNDLDSMPAGSTALATGTIGAFSPLPDPGLVVFDAEGYRVQGRRGPAWSPMLLVQQSFRLQTRGGSLTVQRQSAALVAPRHARWVGEQRYYGFREGDEVTVAGVVAREDGGAILIARVIYGGTPTGLTRRVGQQGLLIAGVGLTAVLIGALLLRAFHGAR